MAIDLLGVFTAGLLTFLTPCVLPLVPIYLAAIAGGDLTAARADRSRLVIRALWFALGFEGVFVLLGLAATAVGAFLITHKAALQAGGAVLIALFGLKFLGVIRIPWLETTLRADDRKLMTRLGWLNALVLGVVFAAGWSPCVGPVLGSVLTYTAATTSDPLLGAGYLGTYGLGFALPLLMLAAFAEIGLRWLAGLGRYLRRIELGLGALLLIVAVALALDALPALRAPAAAEPVAPATVTGDAGPVLLAFTSTGCSICERMQPILHAITERCDGNRVRVEQIDLADPDNRPLARRYHLVGVPTFVFADPDGAEVARLVGEQTEQTLMRALGALRGEPCPGLAILDDAGEHLHPDDVTPLAPAPPACATGLAPMPASPAAPTPPTCGGA